MFAGETLQSAFSDREWCEGIAAFFEAVGLVVTVMDRDAREVVFATERCAYCDVAMPDEPGTGCLGSATVISETWQPTTCRGGLPCYVCPVPFGEQVGCLVAVGGFASSTRERNTLLATLVDAGVSPEVARETSRDVPLLPRREVQALARMLVAQATAALARAAENARWATRVRELELFVEAGTAFGISDDRNADVAAMVLERAIGIVAADCGTVMSLRPKTDILEVVAVQGDACCDAMGARVRLGEGIAGRVARTGRSVLVTGDREEMLCHSMKPGRGITQAISVPIARDGGLMGVLNVGITDPDRWFTGEEVRLVDRFAGMAAVALDNARGHRASERATFELMKLSEYAKSLSVTASIEDVVGVTASVLEKAFDFDLAGVMVTGWCREQAMVVVGAEVPGNVVPYVIAEAAGWDDMSTPIDDVRLITHRAELAADASDVGDWSVLTSEIMIQSVVAGHLFLASRTEGAFDAEDKRLMDGLAEHAAAALNKAALFARLRDDYTRTISALSATLDAGERAPRGHSDRVMDYAMAVGEELGLAREDIEILRFAGLLHDIGKVGLADEILLKPSRLTEEEMAKVRMHPQIGADIVDQLELLEAMKPVILHHHERWDGEGYPLGLAGEDIPLLARILAVADAFDVMTSDRPYHRRLSFSEARRELEAQSGTQFDPSVVTALVESLTSRALAGSTGLFAPGESRRQLPS